MKLKKEWNDVECTTKELLRIFGRWYKSNLRITQGSGSTLDTLFGFPYESSGEYAAIWNTNAEAFYRKELEWQFEGLAVSEKDDAVVILEHEDGTAHKLDRKYVTIGKLCNSTKSCKAF